MENDNNTIKCPECGAEIKGITFVEQIKFVIRSVLLLFKVCNFKPHKG